MVTISSLVHDRGGLLHKRQLVRLGAHDHHLTLAVRRGEVRRVRRGWYSTWAPDDPRYIAVRVGGRLTGAAALAQLGAWLWQEPRVTVSVPGNASRLRWRRGVRVVWDRPEVAEHGTPWSVGVRDAIRQAMLELPFEEAVAVLDWALCTGSLDLDDVGRLAEELPRDMRMIADWVDPACQSIIESISRTRLRIRGHRVTTQEPVGGNRYIDLVVDGVVGLELDGRAFHESGFEKDRCKDLEILIEGRTAMRASYSMVRGMWPRIVMALDAAIAAHRGAVSASGNSGPTPRPARGCARLWRLPARRRVGPELPKADGWGAPSPKADGWGAPSPRADGWGAPSPRAHGRRDASRRAASPPTGGTRRGLTRRVATIYG